MPRTGLLNSNAGMEKIKELGRGTPPKYKEWGLQPGKIANYRSRETRKTNAPTNLSQEASRSRDPLLCLRYKIVPQKHKEQGLGPKAVNSSTDEFILEWDTERSRKYERWGLSGRRWNLRQCLSSPSLSPSLIPSPSFLLSSPPFTRCREMNNSLLS